MGASARDMVLHYGHGAKIERATSDLDFGIQVPDWTAFEALKARLIEAGFKETEAAHRLISPRDVQVDIVPFGELEDGNANIQWPPKGDFVMNVLGFREACDSAEIVRVQDDPAVDVPVVTPPGMAILKLIAWMDRDPVLRGKDASDLRYLLTTYEKVPTINSQLYENQILMERYDWDLEQAAAYQLGVDSRNIASGATSQTILVLLEDRHPKLKRDKFLDEMGGHILNIFDRDQELLAAFTNGFTEYY